MFVNPSSCSLCMRLTIVLYDISLFALMNIFIRSLSALFFKNGYWEVIMSLRSSSLTGTLFMSIVLLSLIINVAYSCSSYSYNISLFIFGKSTFIPDITGHTKIKKHIVMMQNNRHIGMRLGVGIFLSFLLKKY